MEQTDTCECHHHVIFVTCIDNIVISYRTTRLCNICNTTLVCSFNVVSKWEEGVRSKSDTCQFVQPFSLFFSCKYGFSLNYSAMRHLKAHPYIPHRYKDQLHCLCLHVGYRSRNGRFITCRRSVLTTSYLLSVRQVLYNGILDCCPAPIPIACPSFTKHTELDCVYFKVIMEIARSILAASEFFTSVTIFEKKSLSIFNSFLPCSNVIPNTSLCSNRMLVHNPDRSE